MKLKNVSRKKDTDNHKGPTLASERKGWMYLDLLLDEAKEILAYVDINLRYLHVNKAHADWLGLQKNDFTGRYVSETLDDQTFKQLLPQFIKAFDGEHIYYTYQRNSALIVVELIPKYKNPTEIMGCIWMVKETSQENEIGIESETSTIEKKSFLNLDIDLLSIFNADGDFIQVNRGWVKVLGLNLNEIEHHNIIPFIHEEDREMTLKIFDNLKTKNEEIGFTNRLICKEGKYRWFEWHFQVKDSLIYSIAHDINKYICTHENLEASISKLNELNSSKDQFLAIIAHDLKSPFNSILGFTDLLQSNIESYTPELLKQILGQLHSSSKMPYDLLENLLDWSRFQTDRIDFEPTSLNLNELIDNCLPMFQLIAQSKRISIEISCPSDITVFADQNLTKTILRNLVSNAVKFSNINDNIRIQAQQINNLINISITDKGIGIPAHNIPKLFRVDQKYSTLGTMNERGTGLGLILCKDFVEKQGGTIRVDSKEGEGSVFCFTLPC